MTALGMDQRLDLLERSLDALFRDLGVLLHGEEGVMDTNRSF